MTKTTKNQLLSLIAFVLVLVLAAAQPIYSATYKYDSLGRHTEIVYNSGEKAIYSY